MSQKRPPFPAKDRAKARAKELAVLQQGNKLCIHRASFGRLVKEISSDMWTEPGGDRRFTSHYQPRPSCPSVRGRGVDDQHHGRLCFCCRFLPPKQKHCAQQGSSAREKTPPFRGRYEFDAVVIFRFCSFACPQPFAGDYIRFTIRLELNPETLHRTA